MECQQKVNTVNSLGMLNYDHYSIINYILFIANILPLLSCNAVLLSRIQDKLL